MPSSPHPWHPCVIGAWLSRRGGTLGIVAIKGRAAAGEGEGEAVEVAEVGVKGAKGVRVVRVGRGVKEGRVEKAHGTERGKTITTTGARE